MNGDNRDKLLKEAADTIDGIDTEIGLSNDRKRDVYANIRESVSPEEFRAWRQAVRLRQKRRTHKAAMEEHDDRVWAFLNMLEGVSDQPTAKSLSAASVSPANGILDASYAHAHEDPADRWGRA